MIGSEIIVGHMVGDYLLQNDYMALNKKKWSLKGWWCCSLHCALYTLAVCAVCGWWTPKLFALVFLSHMALDKTMLVVWWMRLYGSFRQTISGEFSMHVVWCYALVDNTIHLLSLWLIAKYLV